ncbi:unnamed protein product [Victoria cruziana]
MGVRLSGGTPKSTQNVRQRHSNSGYASSGEDLEDDASSQAVYISRPQSPRVGVSGVLEFVFWILSSAFIIYYGDGRSNFVSMLLWDTRIKRVALNLGFIFISLNCAIVVYTMWWRIKQEDETFDASTSTAVQIVVMIGILSFLTFSVALWPIWSYLTLPLLLTLLMAFIAVSQHIPPFRKFRSQADLLRED